jgi:hypothetical protein
VLSGYSKSLDIQIKELKLKKITTRDDIKVWISTFCRQHGRQPSIEDKKSSANNAMFEEYAAVKVSLAALLDQREEAIGMLTQAKQTILKKEEDLSRLQKSLGEEM